jgi:hypothetical protein
MARYTGPRIRLLEDWDYAGLTAKTIKKSYKKLWTTRKANVYEK